MKGSFCRLRVPVLGKAGYLRDFGKGLIVMARRLRASNLAAAKLIGCSRAAIVSTCQKRKKDGETVTRLLLDTECE